MTAVARLAYLSEKDTKTRWGIIASATVAMATTGFVADISGHSLEYAERIALLVGVLVWFGRIAIVCAPSGKGLVTNKPVPEVKHIAEKAHS